MKMHVIYVDIVVFQWSSFFSDILSTLQLGPAAMDIFLRILKTIDEEVINREVQQSSKVWYPSMEPQILQSSCNINHHADILLIILLFLHRNFYKNTYLSPELSLEL